MSHRVISIQYNLARRHLPYCPQYKLDVIRHYLGWSLVGSHSALKDCEDTKTLSSFVEVRRLRVVGGFGSAFVSCLSWGGVKHEILYIRIWWMDKTLSDTEIKTEEAYRGAGTTQ